MVDTQWDDEGGSDDGSKVGHTWLVREEGWTEVELMVDDSEMLRTVVEVWSIR